MSVFMFLFFQQHHIKDHTSRLHPRIYSAAAYTQFSARTLQKNASQWAYSFLNSEKDDKFSDFVVTNTYIYIVKYFE